MRKKLLPSFMLSLVTATAVGEQIQPPAPAASPIRVWIKTVEHEAVRGRLVSMSLSDGIVLNTDTGEELRIPTRDVVRVLTRTLVSEHSYSDATLTLVSGDMIHGRFADTVGDHAVLETIDLGRLSVPLDAVVRVDYARASQPAYQDAVTWLAHRPASNQDRILLTNGDVLRGFITAIFAAGLSIESAMGETQVPHRMVVTVRLADAQPVVLKELHTVATLRTSGRLRLTDLRWSGQVLHVELSFGRKLSIEAERLVRLDVVGGRWEWLAQHQPISFEHTPMLALDWNYVVDRNVLGGPIAVSGERYEHGIGVHSRSSLTFDLKGEYRAFVSFFGIDDESGSYADVSVAVLVDGKRRFSKSQVRRGTLHGPIRLDLKKAKRIELVVDFGEYGDLQDRFNWVNAALIR